MRLLKHIAILVAFHLATTLSAQAGAPDLTVPLWPEGQMPGIGAKSPEIGTLSEKDNILRIKYISQPNLAVFKAPGTKAPTPAVIICPGGAYACLAYNIEGTEVAEWFSSIGVTAVVLKYRVPNTRDAALQDIQRAVRLMRTHAAEWGIDPERIGVIGFSAGGHLCAHLSNHYAQPAYPKIDDADEASCKPAFSILVYPAYLERGGQLAPELPVSSSTPPTFIVHSTDDAGFLPGTKIYFAALQAAQVPSLLRLYSTGGHGYGLRCYGKAGGWSGPCRHGSLQCPKEASVWPGHCREWLVQNGFLR